MKKEVLIIVLVTVLAIAAAVGGYFGFRALFVKEIDDSVEEVVKTEEKKDKDKDKEDVEKDDGEKKESSSSEKSKNKYNSEKYYNESGRTIQDIADEQGITVEEFLVAYSLPADMPADTEEAAAYYNIPVLKLAEMSNMTFDQFITILGLEDEGIKATDPWGEVEDKVTLGAYIGEEELEEFKKEYKLGDDVNEDTRFGEVRKQVVKVQREQKEAE
ncbi:MAG: hypothetical protein Q4B31_02245 [Clostridia bacterium]|nr:hypothetical protein [Clostridia bacterium]